MGMRRSPSIKKKYLRGCLFVRQQDYLSTRRMGRTHERSQLHILRSFFFFFIPAASGATSHDKRSYSPKNSLDLWETAWLALCWQSPALLDLQHVWNETKVSWSQWAEPTPLAGGVWSLTWLEYWLFVTSQRAQLCV